MSETFTNILIVLWLLLMFMGGYLLYKNFEKKKEKKSNTFPK